jgi:hypothetical protein
LSTRRHDRYAPDPQVVHKACSQRTLTFDERKGMSVAAPPNDGAARSRRPMTEASASPADPEVPPGIDTSVAHVARVYDYLVGGTNNFAVDRAVAVQSAASVGGIENARADVRSNREFLGRAVRWLVEEAGIRQFLDIGTGLPNADNVHAVAQQTAADCRIVYVDNDPLVLVHAETLLESTSEGAASFIIGDLREPESVLLRAAATLDMNQPIALMLISLMHLVPDSEDPYGIVARLVEALPSGSYLALSHLAKDVRSDEMEALSRAPGSSDQEVNYTFVMRTRSEVERFMDGLELVEPGLVLVNEWRPDATMTPSDRQACFYAVVGRKP